MTPMPGPTLSAEELAEELGRSRDWLYDKWRDLTSNEKMPRPLHNGATPLTWSRAQIYAWFDRDLDKSQRVAAQAYRAAAAAAAGTAHIPASTLAIAETNEHWRQTLDQKFNRGN
jgi:predicted DNA-binding transcriptional regulator AlpA